MTTKHQELPDGIGEQSPEWHKKMFREFTKHKQEVNEPSPHLAMVGRMSAGCSTIEKVWRIGCYAIPYSLPVGMMTWQTFTAEQAMSNPKKVTAWVEKNWLGILKGTRRERRCVRTIKKYSECIASYIKFMRDDMPVILSNPPETFDPLEYYEFIWDAVQHVKFFGRYIGIRVVEGLRRYCGIPAELQDIRSMGAWSPRKCLVYLYPDKSEILLNESAENNMLTESIAWGLSKQTRKAVPTASHYVIAAMLCEYRDAFEDRRQYVGWTIDQEPLLFKKSAEYFGEDLDSKLFWNTRRAVFPRQALGELNGWEGTRWELTNILRDYGYVWTDLIWDYTTTMQEGGDFSKPVMWV